MLRKHIPIWLLVAFLAPAGAIADDLTKTIQEDLNVLGYDTGNVQGELTTETIIAISQFQAEHDLEVTGEVTPQLVGVVKAKLDEMKDPAAAAQPAAQPTDPAALQAAQQACLREKVEAAQASRKKKRGFGSLMRAVTNTAARFAGGNDLARQVQETSYDIYKVDATAEDWERAAEDLGLGQSDLEECRNPGSGTTLSAGVNTTPSQSGNTSATTAGTGAMQQLTPEQRKALEESGMAGMFDKMMGGAASNQPNPAPQPDRNIALPDAYSFSHRITMRVTSSRGTAEPVFYAQFDAPFYARKQTKDGVTQYLVYDNERNLAVLYAEKDGEKRMIHNRINLETKAMLVGAFRAARQEAPVKSLGSKKILGYTSEGYEISTLAGTTEIWVTEDAPASLFSTMFRNRASSKGEPPLDENSMILEIAFTSARTPEENYHMECTELQSEALTLKTSDYQSS